MNIAVAISNRDKVLAMPWARWLASVGVLPGTTIFLTFDQKVDDDTISRIHHVLNDVAEVNLDIYFGEDPGYPGGANRMFVFTARRAAKAKVPFLWMEADMIPLGPGWMEAVKKEYKAKKKPFLGPVLHVYDTPHLNGTAVYPPNWEKISNITECPDHYPWDTFGRKTVMPHTAVSETLHHSYGNKTFPKDSSAIPEGVVVFHPCKDGSLIQARNKELGLVDPKLLNIVLNVDPCYVRIEGYTPGLRRFKTHRVNMPGVDWHILKLETLEEQSRAARLAIFTEITESEFNLLKNT